MNVKDLMSAEVISVGPSKPLKQVAALLSEHGISGVPVCDADGRVLGVVSEGDILYKERGDVDRRIPLAWLAGWPREDDLTKGAARTAGEAMTSPAITITPDRPVAAAARIMIERDVNRLPVVKRGALVGIVTRADLVRAFARPDETIAAEIREDVLRRALWVDPDLVDVIVEQGEVELAGEFEARSDAEVLAKLVKRVPGVVSVRSNVLWRIDDTVRSALMSRR